MTCAYQLPLPPHTSHGDVHTWPTNPPVAAEYPEGWKTLLPGTVDMSWGTLDLHMGSAHGVMPGAVGCAPRRVPHAQVLTSPFICPQLRSRFRGGSGRCDRDRDAQHRDQSRHPAHPGEARVRSVSMNGHQHLKGLQGRCPITCSGSGVPSPGVRKEHAALSKQDGSCPPGWGCYGGPPSPPCTVGRPHLPAKT